MKNPFKPDFDTNKVPGTIISDATMWYSRNSKFFTLLLIIGCILAIDMAVLTIAASFVENFFEEFDTAMRINSRFMTFLLLVGGCLVAYSHVLAGNQKSVIKKYLNHEIEDAKRRVDNIRKQAVRQTIDWWVQLDIKTQRKVIMDSYSKLDTEVQKKIQDDFLDILNQKTIKLHQLPDELLPKFDLKEDAKEILFKKIERLQLILKNLDTQ